MATNDKLTSVLLNGSNYQVWVRQAKFGLISRDKLDHVTGDKERPSPKEAIPTETEKTSIKQWDKDDTLVIGWLLNSMEPQINDLMSYQNTSRQIWDKAAARFARKKNFARVYQIQQEIQQIQHTGQTTSELFNQLQKKQDEIKVYRPPTGELEEHKKREEQNEIFLFLSKLDSSYEAVRSQILLASDLPTLDEVAAMIEGEETRRSVMGHHAEAKSEGQAFGAFTKAPAAKPRYNSNPRSDTAKKCDNCKKEGHTRDECWFLHPHLRPTRARKGGDREGGGERGEKFSFLCSAEEKEGENEISNQMLSVKGKEQGSTSMDPLQQLAMQLSVLLQQNSQKSGMENQECDW